MDADRLVRAVLANLDEWIDAASDIADLTDPKNEPVDLRLLRRRALHHKLNMMQVKNSLESLLGMKQTDFTGRV